MRSVLERIFVLKTSREREREREIASSNSGAFLHVCLQEKMFKLQTHTNCIWRERERERERERTRLHQGVQDFCFENLLASAKSAASNGQEREEKKEKKASSNKPKVFSKTIF